MLTGTNSVIHAPGTKLGTGVPSWKQRRKQSTVDQTKIRTQDSCPKERGRAGRCKAIRKRAYWLRKSTAQVEDGKTLTVRVARQVWVQRAAHSKRLARKKPIPKNQKVKRGGHVRGHAVRAKKTHPNTYLVRGYRPYGPTQRKKPEAYSGTYITSKKDKTDERNTKRTAYPKRSKGRRRKYYERSTARPAGNSKIRGGAAGRKHNFRTRFASRVSAKMRGGAGDRKAENVGKKNRTTEKNCCATSYLVRNNREVAPNLNPRRTKNKKWPEHKMGTEVARGTREIVKAQMDQNQEETAATESKRGKRREGV